ncbi:MAG: GAF domain-containing protein [Deltaproteobacteria bacterium]|nr:GAF domain-containing protein [Deltaproteobacteria bacterium]
MSSSSISSRIDEPLYNSRLIKNYIEYVKKFHPEADIDSILNHAYINRYEIEDQGHWFSQWQVDRFHERLLKETKNPNISREVGRYMASSEASGPLKQYIMGFMTPSDAYWFLEKIVPHLSRAFTLKIKKLGPNKVEASATPNPGVTERPYQCDNRWGQFEALTKLFTNRYANIEHPTCLHRGDETCRYIISWEKTPSFMWRRVRFFLISLAVLALAALYFFVPPIYYAGLIFFFASVILGIAIYSEQVEKNELVRNIKDQSNAARLLLNEINRRYNDTLLVKEIGQATSKILDVDDLFKSVIESMKKLLDYDRGGIWIVNKEETRLIYRVGYGYDTDIENVLKGSDFHLDRPASKGVAVEAFRKQRPFLVNDVSEIEKDLSARSLEFMKKTGAQSFICVPLVYEQRSFGIILVDNLRSKRTLSQSDMSLLTGVSRQVAISINNAMSYEELKASKERERNIRKLFERYVPPSVIRNYVSEDVDLFCGEEAAISVLFLDIRGFTSSSENMDVGDVVLFLNDYFEKCSRIISEEHGHINKYTGDGFLAIFGAPEPLGNHAAVCFNTACRLLDLSSSLILGDSPMGIGIGLHTGKAILGNLGSQTKMEYTAIGDTVNTAARLQELTKQFEAFPIVMSRDVLDKIDNDHPWNKSIMNLGQQKIRGKRDSIEVFGLSVFREGSLSVQGDRSGLVPLHRSKDV